MEPQKPGNSPGSQQGSIALFPIFGCIADNAEQFLLQQDNKLKFFEDENTNKFLLAVTVIHPNDWFEMCCRLYCDRFTGY